MLITEFGASAKLEIPGIGAVYDEDHQADSIENLWSIITSYSSYVDDGSSGGNNNTDCTGNSANIGLFVKSRPILLWCLAYILKIGRAFHLFLCYCEILD